VSEGDAVLAPPPVLEVVSVRLTRGGRRILDDVSISLSKQGEVCGLLGSNGAGKTSILKVITGLVRPDSGTVRVRGGTCPYGRMPEDVGALIEEPRFYPWLSARDNLFVVAGGRSERVERIDHLLNKVGLADRGDEKVRVYSQGMRQRLGIARALLSDPPLLLLDEPSNGLDPEGIAWLRSLLSELSERGATVVVTSHVLAEIQRTCGLVVVVGAGRIVANGAMSDVLGGYSSLEELYFSLSDGLVGRAEDGAH
jgi:ABC-2 type transport system ATP-binding protein